MAQPPPTRQLSHNGPAGLLKCAISSAEQHIVQAPHDFPGAAVIHPSHYRPPGESRRVEQHLYHCSSPRRADFVSRRSLDNERRSIRAIAASPGPARQRRGERPSTPGRLRQINRRNGAHFGCGAGSAARSPRRRDHIRIVRFGRRLLDGWVHLFRMDDAVRLVQLFAQALSRRSRVGPGRDLD